jgi:hypothetical protein
VIVLIIANLVSLFGVLFWGWSATLLLLAYWFESAIIGFFTVIKIIMAQKITSERSFHLSEKQSQLIKNMPISPIAGRSLNIFAKLFMVPFFIVHFGGFMAGHLVFIVVMFAIGGSGLSFEQIVPGLFTISLLLISLFISHAYSFVTNFIGKKEYENISVGEAMMAPYPRIIVMHIAIIVGAFLTVPIIIFTGGGSESFFSLGQAIVLIVLKTGFDVVLHIRQHIKLGAG